MSTDTTITHKLCPRLAIGADASLAGPVPDSFRDVRHDREGLPLGWCPQGSALALDAR